MDAIPAYQYILIVILIILSAFFSATETAYSSLNKIKLKNLASGGNKGNKNAKLATQALHVYSNYDKAITAILIGNNVVNIASASIATLICTALFKQSGAVISTVLMTIIVLIFGEVVPKAIAKQNAEIIALKVSPILSGLMTVLTPLTFLFSVLIKAVNKKFSKGTSEPSVSEEELKIIIEEIEDEGVLEQHESELVQSALDFGDITVDEVLTPRVDIVAIEKNDNIDKIKDLFINEGYSRMPVYDKTMDHIIGVLGSKDFFVSLINHEGETKISDLMSETMFVPPKKRVDKLLKEMQIKKMHQAVVTDQYGGTLGIVTFEDLIEELVGDIWDETDEVEEDVTEIATNHYIISGDTSIDDFFEEFEYDEDEYDGSNKTVSGWALEFFEKIPEVGESFKYKNIVVTAHDVQEQRIISLEVIVKDTDDATDISL